MSQIMISDSNDGTRYDHLPPVICPNIRPKVEAAQIPIHSIQLKQKAILHHPMQRVYYPTEPPPEPMSKYPLILFWEPDHLHFDLYEEPVEAKLSVSNGSDRPIQMQCCGLWDDSCKLGASWRSYPRTRFWMPSGLKVNLFVRATPRPTTPIPSAVCSLQLAATHLRDRVTGYFMVPIYSRFLKYVKPPTGEEE